MLSIHIAWPLAGICWFLFLLERMRDDLKTFLNARDGSR
jgi:hypothetical protein